MTGGAYALWRGSFACLGDLHLEPGEVLGTQSMVGRSLLEAGDDSRPRAPPARFPALCGPLLRQYRRRAAVAHARVAPPSGICLVTYLQWSRNL